MPFNFSLCQIFTSHCARYYYLHFTDEEMEAQTIQGNSPNFTQQSQDLNLDLILNLVFIS